MSREVRHKIFSSFCGRGGQIFQKCAPVHSKIKQFFYNVALRALVSYIIYKNFEKEVMNINIRAEKCSGQSRYSCYSSYATVCLGKL